MNTPEPKKIRELIMASIDGEITVEEERSLREILLNNPNWAEEYRELKKVKEMTSQAKLKEPKPELWDTYKHQTFTRIERGIGWILFTVGALVLLLYGAWQALSQILTDPGLAWWIKAAVVSGTAGLIILIVSFIREKLYLDKHERYKDIVR